VTVNKSLLIAAWTGTLTSALLFLSPEFPSWAPSLPFLEQYQSGADCSEGEELDRQLRGANQLENVQASATDGLADGSLTLVRATDTVLAAAREYRPTFLLNIQKSPVVRNLRQQLARHLIGRLFVEIEIGGYPADCIGRAQKLLGEVASLERE
jgi:hypothetical protein